MLNTPEKLTAASKHSYQTQMTLLHEFGQKVFESGNKLLTLHTQIGKALLEDGKVSINQWLHSKHPFDFWNQHSNKFQPTMDHLLQYKIQLAKIFSETQTELLSYSLKKAISLQDGLIHPGEHPKAEPHPVEPKAASPLKPASASTEPGAKATAKPASTKAAAKPASKVTTKPAAKVASKNAVKAAPSATSKPAAPKAVVKAKPVLTAVPTRTAPTVPQVEPKVEHLVEPQAAAVAPVAETTTPQAS